MSLALSTALVVTSVSALGLPVAAQKLVAEAREIDVVRRDRLIDITLGMTASVGLLAMIGGALSSAWVADGILDQPDVAPLVAVASILILTTPMVEVLAGLLAALERFGTVGLFRAVHGSLCGVLLVIVLLSTSGAMAALWALAAAEALACVLGLRLVTSARGPRVNRPLWAHRAPHRGQVAAAGLVAGVDRERLAATGAVARASAAEQATRRSSARRHLRRGHAVARHRPFCAGDDGFGPAADARPVAGDGPQHGRSGAVRPVWRADAGVLDGDVPRSHRVRRPAHGPAGGGVLTGVGGARRTRCRHRTGGAE